MVCAVLLAWAVLSIAMPQQGPDPRLISVIILLPQAVIVILIVRAIRRRSGWLGHAPA
jgi:hypothetical protein